MPFRYSVNFSPSSLPFLQGSITRRCSEPVEYSLHPYTLFVLLTTTLILSFEMRLCFPTGLFPSGFDSKNVNAFFVF